MQPPWTWNHQDDSGSSVELKADQHTVRIQHDEKVEETTLVDFFKMYAPCHDFPLAVQNEIMSRLAMEMKDYNDLPEQVLPVVNFWLCFPELSIPRQEYRYETKVTKSYRWHLTIEHSGITYMDVDGDYGMPPKSYNQTLCDFWFYGPLYPIPDQSLRSSLIKCLRDTLLNAGFAWPDGHFKILDYSSFAHYSEWEDGDYIVSDFVLTRDFGIEWGRQNFHDGLVFLGFLSYEQCLTRTDLNHATMTREILTSIRNEILSAD